MLKATFNFLQGFFIVLHTANSLRDIKFDYNGVRVSNEIVIQIVWRFLL